MSLEAIKQVTETEEKAKNDLAEAQAGAKRILADATREGEAKLAAALAAAEGEAKAEMERAEARGAEHAKKVEAETQSACTALKAQAEGRLSKAVDFIVERVVKS